MDLFGHIESIEMVRYLLARGINHSIAIDIKTGSVKRVYVDRTFGQNGLNQQQYIYVKKNTKINPDVLTQGYNIWRQQQMK